MPAFLLGAAWGGVFPYRKLPARTETASVQSQTKPPTIALLWLLPHWGLLGPSLHVFGLFSITSWLSDPYHLGEPCRQGLWKWKVLLFSSYLLRLTDATRCTRYFLSRYFLAVLWDWQFKFKEVSVISLFLPDSKSTVYSAGSPSYSFFMAIPWVLTITEISPTSLCMVLFLNLKWANWIENQELNFNCTPVHFSLSFPCLSKEDQR